MNERNKKKVCFIGSGNAGSALAKIAAMNCTRLNTFQNVVTMYVYEEMIDDRKLTDIINEIHENVKYLPGRKLGTNVVAMPDMGAVVKDADVIVFAVPLSTILTVCAALLGKIRHSAIGVSMIKGFYVTEQGTLELVSRVISNRLKIQTCVFSGFAFPEEIAENKFAETTIGSKFKRTGPFLTDVFQTKTFRIVLADDVDTVELCNSLKTVVGCAAGIVDGLGQKYNCKAAIVRMGLIEMVKFIDLFYPNGKLSTVFESTIVADLLLCCFYGRERRVSEALVRTGKTLEIVEEELLHGQKLEGAQRARDIHNFLTIRGAVEVFPLFHAVHRVFLGDLQPEDFLPTVRSHPEHHVHLQKLGW